MKRWVLTVVIAVVCSAAALGAGLAIGGKSAPRPAAVARVVADEDQGRRVRLPGEIARHAGVRTERVARGPITPALELVGSIDFDADRVADVGGRIPGRVTRVLVGAGADVQAGDALVEVESAALGDVLANYLSAQANAVAARARLRRETDLARQQLTTARALEDARTDVARYAAEERGAEHRLLAMGASPREALRGSDARRVTLRSPIAGRVIHRDAVVGQTIDETARVMRIADLTRVWVHLDVFERDLARVRVGDHAEIASETYPGRSFMGAVSYVDATIDAHTRTARVRIAVDNTGQLLRPGQFVSARLRTSASAPHEAVTVPRAAVIQLEGRPAVFVALSADEFEPRTVTLGPSDGDRVEVERGLDDGETVVVQGAFALKSELQR